MEVKNIVGQRMRHLRIKAGLSQKAVADMFDTSQANVNRYENGVAEAKLVYILAYANYFGVSLDYIFGRVDNADVSEEAMANTRIRTELKQYINTRTEVGKALYERLLTDVLELYDSRATDGSGQ